MITEHLKRGERVFVMDNNKIREYQIGEINIEYTHIYDDVPYISYKLERIPGDYDSQNQYYYKAKDIYLSQEELMNKLFPNLEELKRSCSKIGVMYSSENFGVEYILGGKKFYFSCNHQYSEGQLTDFDVNLDEGNEYEPSDRELTFMKEEIEEKFILN